MGKIDKKFLPILILPLFGLGCLQTGSNLSDAGGLWLSTDAGANWESMSSVPTVRGIRSFTSADIASLTFDAADSDALYAGTVENGLLFSYDNGASWQAPEESTARTGRARATAVDPRDVCLIYAAVDSRVLKSEDCNRTYDVETFVEGSGKAINALVVDWYTPETVWLATSAGDIVKSTDSGASWTSVTRLGEEVVALLISNADSRIVLAVTEDEGLWRTDDGGGSWTELNETMTNWKYSEEGYALAQNSDGSVIYYASKHGLLRSEDGGVTWTDLTLLTDIGTRIWSLVVDPDDGDVVYYGTVNTLYVTTDGGSNWATHELPSDRAAVVLAVDPNETERLWLGLAVVEE